jgi:hypothetical protein
MMMSIIDNSLDESESEESLLPMPSLTSHDARQLLIEALLAQAEDEAHEHPRIKPASERGRDEDDRT